MANYTTVPTKGFLKELDKLSAIHRQLVFNKIAIMEEDPFYPSLRSKKMNGDSGYYESSVNMSIRIIWEFGVEDVRLIMLMDIGYHDVLKKY